MTMQEQAVDLDGMMALIENKPASVAATAPNRSLLGFCADLRPAPSVEAIDEARGEIGRNSPVMLTDAARHRSHAA
jgi:hypothetical protein